MAQVDVLSWVKLHTLYEMRRYEAKAVPYKLRVEVTHCQEGCHLPVGALGGKLWMDVQGLGQEAVIRLADGFCDCGVSQFG